MSVSNMHIIPSDDGKVVIRIESNEPTIKDFVLPCSSLDCVLTLITNHLTPHFNPPPVAEAFSEEWGTDTELAGMKHSCRSGTNPAGPEARFSCSHCGLELFGDEIGYVAAGTNYANGEFAPCPKCGEEGSIERDDEENE